MSRLQFNVQPHATNIGIHSLYDLYLKDSRSLTLRPPYQRNLCWSDEQKTNLIDTVMTGCPMPIFLLYMFNDTNECIDGQNRLTTIKEYMEQTVEPFPWKLQSTQEDGSEQIDYIYYTENEHIKSHIAKKDKKCRKNSIKKVYRYMTDQEKKRFHSYEIVLQKIQIPLTLEQRKEIFIKWQSGRPITQCERFKNERHPFCLLVVERSLEVHCADKIASLLKSGKDNWLFDLYRMLLVFLDSNNSIQFSAQNTISARVNITKPDGPYMISNELYMECVEKMLRFLTNNPYLDKIPKPLKKLSFIISFAHIWFTNSSEKRTILQTEEFIDSFVEKCSSSQIKHNTLNNGPHSKELAESYPLLKSIVDEMVSERLPSPLKPKPKQKIPETLKTSVWDKHVGSSIGETECLCCGMKKISQRDFQCSHIIAEAKGGPLTIENLRPTCLKCNQSCGTKNLREFMAEHFPGRKI